MPNGEPYDERLCAVAADLARLVRRLRNLSTKSWRDRREPAHAALVSLAKLSTSLAGVSVPPPVDLADRVLADALTVVGGDVLESLAALPDPARLEEAAEVIRRAWDETR